MNNAKPAETAADFRPGILGIVAAKVAAAYAWLDNYRRENIARLVGA